MATFMLERETGYWWEMTKRLLERSGGRSISWETFLETFYEKYFSMLVRYQKEVEFLNIVQGNESVTTYEAKFTKLAPLSLILYRTNLIGLESFCVG